LVAAQFPQWAHLPIRRVRSAGTDHAIYRLGADMAVRMPRIAWAVEQVEKEQRWLPRLAAHLPLEIPTPLAHGRPGAGYPWHWSVYRWIAGEDATLERLDDAHRAAADLAAFVTALWRIDPTGGPIAGTHNFGRGVPLRERDAPTRAAFAALDGVFDPAALTTAWELALDASRWDRAPVWVHGDLMPGNLLVVAGRIRAVIDFGGLGLGDPACDLMVAWNLFDRGARSTFHAKLGIDAATRTRGRGWALSVAAIQLPYYRDTNPQLAAIARRTIEQVLGEYERRTDA
jgi:aminoglycoside phosphotransferase (APT) family kinase protein